MNIPSKELVERMWTIYRFVESVIKKLHNTKKIRAHITQVSPVDVQKMSISDIGPILWMSVGEPRNIPTGSCGKKNLSVKLNKT